LATVHERSATNTSYCIYKGGVEIARPRNRFSVEIDVIFLNYISAIEAFYY
jgi:hypothetical protein